MNWEFVGATGEWVGAITVIATLFYLGRQIHQQNRTSRYTGWQTLVREFIEHNAVYLGDPEAISLRRRGYESPNSLTRRNWISGICWSVRPSISHYSYGKHMRRRSYPTIIGCNGLVGTARNSIAQAVATGEKRISLHFQNFGTR